MSKRLIFYAEDDADDRFIFEESFSRLQHEADVMLFNDGLELVNHLKKNDEVQKPCLIVLDINMPRLNGKDTLRVIRNLPDFASVPVVLLTTSSSPVDRYFAQHFNAGFISKPMDEMGMKKVVNDLIYYCKSAEI